MSHFPIDTLSRKLAGATSRRSLLHLLGAGAAGATVTAVGLPVAEARKGGKGKGKGKGKTKVFICHRSGTSIDLIRVGSPAAKGHTKHGDTVCGPAGPCQTGDPSGCDQATGACTYTQVTDGTACTTTEGTAGTCTAGVCG